MGTTYPAQIDTTQTLPTAIQAIAINQLRDTILAIEVALGVQPGGYSSVAARFSALEFTVGNLQNIQLDQDLGGTLASPLVIGIQGRPISNIGPGLGQVLGWNGIAWSPVSTAGAITFSGDLVGTSGVQTVIGLLGYPLTYPSINNTVLTWNGSALVWTAGSGFTAGQDLSGTSSAQNVIGIRGHSVPSPSGSNTVLTWTGSALEWNSSGGGSSLQTILQNRSQNLVTAASTTISGGTNIVNPVTITMVASGKVRITANAGYQTSGFTTPLIWVSVNGGSLQNVFTCQEQAGNFSTVANVQMSISFELNTAATIGQTVEVYFQTTSGDASIHIYTNGTGDAGASLLVEELP